MRLGGCISAAISILDDMESHHRPISITLRDWGVSHRFAGSGDRSVIGNLVYDSLRRRSSLSYLMDSSTSRSVIFGVLLSDWQHTPASLLSLFTDDKYAPDPLSESEHRAFTTRALCDAPPHIQADIPDWLIESFQSNFSDDWLCEARSLSARPPLDLRTNTLRVSREKLLKSFASFNATPTSISRFGLRIPATTADERHPNIQSESSFQKGWFEVQDEGSQIVSDLVLARPGEQVLDFCAGSGGKTLALSSLMENVGQVHAYDSDRHRLKPIYARLRRARSRNVQVYQTLESLESLTAKMDRVIVDAPCTGTGVWRRRPDAKWKLTLEMLEQRIEEQDSILHHAQSFVRPNGYLIYITCSVLPQENEARIQDFLSHHSNFELLSAGEAWQELFGYDCPRPWSSDMKSITLTPAATSTDGFFFAILHRVF